MVIRLKPDIEAAVIDEARRRGSTPEQVANDALGRAFLAKEADRSEQGGSLLDFLSGYIGTVNGTTEPMSENCGERFAEGLLEKQSQGRL